MINSNKKNQQINAIINVVLVMTLIIALSIVFFYTWINDYNVLLRFPYIMKGNIFITFVYIVLLYIFMIIFDCNNLSTQKIVLIIISEFLSVIFCNTLVYLLVIIPTASIGFLPFMPILYMTLNDMVIIVIWSLLVLFLYNNFYSPKKLLLISNDVEIDEIIHKISKRKDLYDIDSKITFNRDKIKDIYAECDKYDNILIGDLTSEDRNDVLKYSFNTSKDVYLIPKLSDILIKYSDDIFAFDTPIYYSSNFSLSLESKFIKRIIDIALSLIVILVFLPFWLIVAILIKLEDNGPVFYFQERVTIDLKKFTIIKFRSMKVDKTTIVRPTTDDDDRITKIGAFIRKFHIDEIPQFINVLIGDMSIVGPRPERIEHVKLYSEEIPEFTYRYKVKAGITGLAQIYGKYNTSAINKLKLDLIYIKRYSVIFDLELIFRTIKVLFLKDNTEGFNEKSKDHIMTNANK